MQIETREQALKVIKDHFGMNIDFLRDTIGYSTDHNDYTDSDLILFAKFQLIVAGEVYDK